MAMQGARDLKHTNSLISLIRKIALAGVCLASHACLGQELPQAAKQAVPAPAQGVDVAVVVEVAVEAGVAADPFGGQPVGDPPIVLLHAYAHVNCALARRVCKLSDAQEAQLAIMTDKWLKSELANAAGAPARNVAAGINRLLRIAPAMQAVGHDDHALMKAVRVVIDQHIANTLTAEQLAVYQQEVDLRAEFRRAAQASVLVSVLDQRLYLSSEQREHLKPLISKWLKKDLYWQFYFQNNSYLPDIPKSTLAQVLTTEQIAALQGAQAWNYESEQIELQMAAHKMPVLIEK